MSLWQRHRGPYRLCVTREHPRRSGFSKTEWPKEEYRSGADALEEATMLVGDPRDTVKVASVYTISGKYFVTGVTRGIQEEAP